MTLKPQGAVATAIFCDDIRQEVGGKFSYMGVYATELIIPVASIFLPKFCVAIQLDFPFGDHPPVSFRLSMGGQQIAVQDFEAIPSPDVGDAIEEPERTVIVAIFQLGSFPINSGSKIEATVRYATDTLLAGRLRIVEKPARQQDSIS